MKKQSSKTKGEKPSLRLWPVFWRIALYSALLIGLAGAFLLSYVQTPMFEEQLRQMLLARLQESINAPVTIESIWFDPLGGRLIIDNLVVESPDGSLANPFNSRTIFVTVDYSQFLQSRLVLERIVVFKPLLEIELTSDGRSNLPTLNPPDPDAPFQTSFENIDIHSGAIVFREHRISLDMESGRISLTAIRRLGPVYTGKTKLRNVRLQLPELLPFTGDLRISFQSSQTTVSGTASFYETGGSSLEIDRWSYDLHNDDAEAHLLLSADLGLLRAAEEMGLQGRIAFSGKLQSAEEKFEIQGSAEQQSLRYRQFEFEELRQKVRYDGETLDLTDINGRVWDGELNGQLSLRNLEPEQTISGRLEIANIDIRSFLKSIDLEPVQANGLMKLAFELDGNLKEPESIHATGTATVKMKDDDVEAWVDAVEELSETDRKELLSNTFIPITASLVFDYADSTVQLAENSVLQTPLSRIRVAGEIGEESIRINLRSPAIRSREAALIAANVDRLAGYTTGSEEEQYPISSFIREFGAAGSASMEIAGPYEELSFSLNANAREVSYRERRLGEGHLEMDFEKNVLEIGRLRFRDNRAFLLIKGNIAFPESGPEGLLDLDFKEFSLDGIESVFDSEPLELSGIVEGELKINIASRISGSGKLDARFLKYSGIAFDKVGAEIEFGERWSLRNLHAIGPHGEEASGTIEFDPETEDWNARLELRALDLGPFARLWNEESDISGAAYAEVDAAGRGLVASGLMVFSVENLKAGDIEFGNITGQLKAEGRYATLQLSAGDDTYTINSETPEGEPDILLLELEKKHLDLSILAQSFLDDKRLYFNVGDRISAKVVFNENEPIVDITLAQVTCGLEQLSVQSLNPVELRFTGKRISLERANFITGDPKENQTINISGSFGLTADEKININTEGEIKLLALNDLFEDFSFGGNGEINIHVGGTTDRPDISGSASVEDGFIRHKDSDLAFSNINGDLEFAGNRVEVIGVTAGLAEGDLFANGFVEIDWENLDLTYYQFDIDGTMLRVSLPDELEASFNGSLVFRGTLNESLLTGDIQVISAYYSKRIDPEKELIRLKQERQPLKLTEETLAQVKLDMGISGSENILIDNNLAKMEVLIDLRLIGTLDEPVLKGRVEVNRGEVFYRERKYTISSGLINFEDPSSMVPIFDFRAETLVKEYRIFLDFHGTLDRLYPELTSDPPQSTIDILHLLAVGKIRDNPFPSDVERLQSQLLGLGVSGFLTKQVTGELERRAERLFGIDRFRIDPFLLGDSANPAARITIGEQLTDDFTIVYSSNLTRETEDVLMFEWRLSPTVLLVGTRDEDESFGIDIHLQHRFK